MELIRIEGKLSVNGFEFTEKVLENVDEKPKSYKFHHSVIMKTQLNKIQTITTNTLPTTALRCHTWCLPEEIEIAKLNIREYLNNRYDDIKVSFDNLTIGLNKK